MLDLSPTKLIIILVVVVVLLGPKRLPEVARQLGAGWRKLRELHLQLDSELRQVVPDLPSSQDIVRFARSPVALLNQLADTHDEPSSTEKNGHAAGAGTAQVGATDARAADSGAADARAADARAEDSGAADAGTAEDGAAPARLVAPALGRLDTDDPNLN